MSSTSRVGDEWPAPDANTNAKGHRRIKYDGGADSAHLPTFPLAEVDQDGGILHENVHPGGRREARTAGTHATDHSRPQKQLARCSQGKEEGDTQDIEYLFTGKEFEGDAERQNHMHMWQSKLNDLGVVHNAPERPVKDAVWKVAGRRTLRDQMAAMQAEMTGLRLNNAQLQQDLARSQEELNARRDAMETLQLSAINDEMSALTLGVGESGPAGLPAPDGGSRDANSPVGDHSSSSKALVVPQHPATDMAIHEMTKDANAAGRKVMAVSTLPPGLGGSSAPPQSVAMPDPGLDARTFAPDGTKPASLDEMMAATPEELQMARGQVPASIPMHRAMMRTRALKQQIEILRYKFVVAEQMQHKAEGARDDAETRVRDLEQQLQSEKDAKQVVMLQLQAVHDTIGEHQLALEQAPHGQLPAYELDDAQGDSAGVYIPAGGHMPAPAVREAVASHSRNIRARRSPPASPQAYPGFDPEAVGEAPQGYVPHSEAPYPSDPDAVYDAVAPAASGRSAQPPMFGYASQADDSTDIRSLGGTTASLDPRQQVAASGRRRGTRVRQTCKEAFMAAGGHAPAAAAVRDNPPAPGRAVTDGSQRLAGAVSSGGSSRRRTGKTMSSQVRGSLRMPPMSVCSMTMSSLASQGGDDDRGEPWQAEDGGFPYAEAEGAASGGMLMREEELQGMQRMEELLRPSDLARVAVQESEHEPVVDLSCASVPAEYSPAAWGGQGLDHSRDGEDIGHMGPHADPDLMQQGWEPELQGELDAEATDGRYAQAHAPPAPHKHERRSKRRSSRRAAAAAGALHSGGGAGSYRDDSGQLEAPERPVDQIKRSLFAGDMEARGIPVESMMRRKGLSHQYSAISASAVPNGFQPAEGSTTLLDPDYPENTAGLHPGDYAAATFFPDSAASLPSGAEAPVGFKTISSHASAEWSNGLTSGENDLLSQQHLMDHRRSPAGMHQAGYGRQHGQEMAGSEGVRSAVMSLSADGGVHDGTSHAQVMPPVQPHDVRRDARFLDEHDTGPLPEELYRQESDEEEIVGTKECLHPPGGLMAKLFPDSSMKERPSNRGRSRDRRHARDSSLTGLHSDQGSSIVNDFNSSLCESQEIGTKGNLHPPGGLMSKLGRSDTSPTRARSSSHNSGGSHTRSRCHSPIGDATAMFDCHDSKASGSRMSGYGPDFETGHMLDSQTSTEIVGTKHQPHPPGGLMSRLRLAGK